LYLAGAGSTPRNGTLTQMNLSMARERRNSLRSLSKDRQGVEFVDRQTLVELAVEFVDGQTTRATLENVDRCQQDAQSLTQLFLMDRHIHFPMVASTDRLLRGGKEDLRSSKDSYHPSIVRIHTMKIENCLIERGSRFGSYERTEMQWLMGMTIMDSTTLMDEATLFYTNLKEAGNWKPEHGEKEQIIAIALSTHLKQLTEQLNSMKAGKSTGSTEVKKEPSNNGRFEEWRLIKVDNKAEHNMIEHNGKKWYWCDKHYRNNKKCGMYCTHTPGEGHMKWQEKKSSWKKSAKADTAATTSAAPDTPKANVSSTVPSSDSKLALSKSLQAALLTTAGLTQDQFQKIWDDACNESGN
jgi:hypothetical protein